MALFWQLTYTLYILYIIIYFILVIRTTHFYVITVYNYKAIVRVLDVTVFWKFVHTRFTIILVLFHRYERRYIEAYIGEIRMN